MSASPTGITTSQSMPALQRNIFMHTESVLKIGQSFHSKRSGRELTIIEVKDGNVYYSVENFKTIAPLFLPLEKFMHLVGMTDSKE